MCDLGERLFKARVYRQSFTEKESNGAARRTTAQPEDPPSYKVTQRQPHFTAHRAAFPPVSVPDGTQSEQSEGPCLLTTPPTSHPVPYPHPVPSLPQRRLRLRPECMEKGLADVSAAGISRNAANSHPQVPRKETALSLCRSRKDRQGSLPISLQKNHGPRPLATKGVLPTPRVDGFSQQSPRG